MESVIKEFANANSYKCSAFNFRLLDKFGVNYGFHVRQSASFQTKIGSLFTLIWLASVVMAFMVYFTKFLDTSEPLMSWNKFRATDPATIHFPSREFHYYWLFRSANKANLGLLNWAEFWPSLTLMSHITQSYTRPDGTAYHGWKNVPIVPCSSLQWVKDLAETDIRKPEIIEAGLCLDETTINISGGGVQPYSLLSVDLYTCQASFGTTCTNAHPQSKVIGWTYVWEQSINVSKYDDPINSAHRMAEQVVFATGYRFGSMFELGDTNLYTDDGFFGKNWAKKTITHIDSYAHVSGPQSFNNIALNYLSHGKVIYADMIWHIQIQTTNHRVEIYRTYFKFLDVIASVGGLLQFITAMIGALYLSYNQYAFYRHIILKVIIGKEGVYPEHYQLKKYFACMYWGCFCCCCNGNYKKDRFQEAKSVNMMASSMIINEKLNLQNFLHDAMDFHAIRQLVIKSRHKILMPALVLHLTNTKLKTGRLYKTSFARNLHERTDQPVFTIEDAVTQLKTNDGSRTELEKNMDAFFLTHLPDAVIEKGEENDEFALDEGAIRQQKRNEMKKKKYESQADFKKRDTDGNAVQKESLKKKQKSDFTLGFTDTSAQVSKLARKSEVGDQIHKMRKSTAKNVNSRVGGRESLNFGPESVDTFEGVVGSPRRGSDRAKIQTIAQSPDQMKRRFTKERGTVLDGNASRKESGFSGMPVQENDDSSDEEPKRDQVNQAKDGIENLAEPGLPLNEHKKSLGSDGLREEALEEESF